MSARAKIDKNRKLERAAQAAIKKYLQRPHPAPSDAHRIISPHPIHNVVGVGIGPKKVNNKNTRTSCIRLYVRHKFPQSRLAKKWALPNAIAGIPTDIIAVGIPRRSGDEDLTNPPRIRPACPGCCIVAAGATDISFTFPGTFGAVLEDGNRNTYILSNNHVLANEDQNSPSTPIYQPSTDANTNKIAELSAVVPLRRPAGNKVDCALARVMQPGDVSGIPLDPVGPLSSDAPIDAAPGMKVEKVGAATAHTTGTVSGVGEAFRIDEYMTGPVLLIDQIHIEDGAQPFCDHGDSGSLIIDTETRQATGLLTINMDGFALANRLSNVLAALSAQLGSPLTLKIS
jgi:hypothetical protein